MLGVPVAKRKIRLDKVNKIILVKGVVTDSLQIYVADDPDPLILRVAMVYRHKTQKIMETLDQVGNISWRFFPREFTDAKNDTGSQNTLCKKIKEIDTLILFLFPWGLILALVWASQLIERFVFRGSLPHVYVVAATTIMFFLLGLSPFAFVIKKELPIMNLVSVRGRPAIIIGMFFVSIFWGFVLLGLYKLFLIVLNPYF
jgi:hypothetical protein